MDQDNLKPGHNGFKVQAQAMAALHNHHRCHYRAPWRRSSRHQALLAMLQALERSARSDGGPK
jgi:hypothetical protein